MDALPNDILFYIILSAPYKTQYTILLYVCKKWYDIILPRNWRETRNNTVFALRIMMMQFHRLCNTINARTLKMTEIYRKLLLPEHRFIIKYAPMSAVLIEKCKECYGLSPELDHVLIKFCDRYDYDGAKKILFYDVPPESYCVLFFLQFIYKNAANPRRPRAEDIPV